MELRHLAFYVFTAEDLEDWFLYDFRKPDEALLIMDDDGFGLERSAESIIRNRNAAGLPDVAILHEFTEQAHRKFCPGSLHEATVVHGEVKKLQEVIRQISENIKKDRSRIRGFNCGVFRWGKQLLWMHFLQPAPVAAVVADQLGLKSYRKVVTNGGNVEASWRKHLSSDVLLNS